MAITDPSFRPVDIVALVKQSEAISREKVSPEVRLNCVFGASELSVPSDATLLSQVLNSFLDNACKYTQRGSITFGFDVNGDELYFFVKDTGVGLTGNQTDEVFDGPTMDLPQAKSIIEGLGGEIGAESRGAGKGSTFWFTIPLGDGAETPAQPAATPQATPQQPQMQQGGWPQQPGWGQPQMPQQPQQPGAWGQQPQQPAWGQQYPQQPPQQPGWGQQYPPQQPGWQQYPQQPQQWGQQQYPQQHGWQPQQPQQWGQQQYPQQQPMQQPQQPVQQPQQQFVPQQPQTKYTILIAEDNESNYILFESILEGQFNLVHALNGQEAVELTRQYNPNLILMDINMPVMDGYEAVKQIRMFNSQVPIIAVTAYAFATDKQRIYDNGFNGYVSKPISIQRLQRLISTHLGINM